jgi:hypothetical protein
MNSFLSPILSKHYEPNIIHDTYYNAVKIIMEACKKNYNSIRYDT